MVRRLREETEERGEETVKIGTNHKNIQAYKFLATVGSEESYERPLNYYIYYDKSFIFIKDENIYNGTSYRKRIDSIPLEFSILLDSITKVEKKIE